MKKKVEGLKSAFQPEETDFGNEVGLDEINWWVFKKEKNINEFRTQSQRALDSAQILKQESIKLKTSKPTSYAELLTTLRRFAEDHALHIDVLREYVAWLKSRDILAPAILFTYRVWGSTRMSDRWTKITAKSPEEEGLDAIQHLTEIVLGLYSSPLYALDSAYYEIGEEIWDAYDEESGAAPAVPMDRVVRVASRKIYDECATYFTFIRD